MNILDQIVAHKKTEVQEKKELYPRKLLEQSIYFSAPTLSMKDYIRKDAKNGIIAEYKRHSPSLGDINRHADVKEISMGYMQAGCSGLSILTDEKYFKGSLDDLKLARQFNFCPIHPK